MNGEFHYSINTLSQEDSTLWNGDHTLEEIRNNRVALRKKALELYVPVGELPEWCVVNQVGLLDNSLHDIYISFKRSWLFTKQGRRRQPSRALRMMGVPFVRVMRTHRGYEIALDGFEVVHIGILNKGEGFHEVQKT